MSAREAILARARQAQRTGYLPKPDGAHDAGLKPCATTETMHGNVAQGFSPAIAELLPRFLKELKGVGVESYVEDSDDAVRARVREIVGNRAALAWDADRLPYGVGSTLTGAAIGASPRDVQAAAEIGVTGCHAALAETGSLVMLSGPGTPRSASLLPPVHLCVVRRADILESMGQWFAEHAAAIASAANCTFITGPSRTADIELTLTLGVHGPGKVIVVVGP